MNLRKNNSGITLMELVISLAIMTIVLTMIAIMINSATRSFKRTNENVNLQLEAQLALNQLSTITMEASSITASSNLTDAGDVKYLLPCPESKAYAVFYRKAKNCIYLIQASDVDEADGINPTASQDLEYQYLMAEYVSGFSIEMNENTAKIIIDFTLGEQSNKVSKVVKLRNKK